MVNFVVTELCVIMKLLNELNIIVNYIYIYWAHYILITAYHLRG